MSVKPDHGFVEGVLRCRLPLHLSSRLLRRTRPGRTPAHSDNHVVTSSWLSG